MGDLQKITQKLQEVEERRKLALDVSYVGIWDWDIVNDNLNWDDNMFEIYDYFPGEFSNNYEAWKSRLHPEDIEKTAQEIKKCMKDEAYRYFYRFRVMHKGEWRWVVGVGNCIHENGKPIRMAGVNILEDATSELACAFADRCPFHVKVYNRQSIELQKK